MRKTIGTFFVATVVGLATMSAGGNTVMPNPRFTSPHYCTTLDKDFKEFRYKDNVPVCRRNVSSGLRQRIYEAYEVPREERKGYTIDHLIPLSLGGSNHAKNLWPQPKDQSTAPIEYQIYLKVSKGEISIFEAWNVILGEKYGDEI